MRVVIGRNNIVFGPPHADEFIFTIAAIVKINAVVLSVHNGYPAFFGYDDAGRLFKLIGAVSKPSFLGYSGASIIENLKPKVACVRDDSLINIVERQGEGIIERIVAGSKRTKGGVVLAPRAENFHAGVARIENPKVSEMIDSNRPGLIKLTRFGSLRSPSG